MKANNRHSMDTLYRYAHWHSGDEVMAKSLAQDAVISAAAFSRQDKGINHRALRMVRRDLKYLDRLENASDPVYRSTPTNESHYAPLRGVLKQLSFDNRDFVILHMILGYGIQELARILDLSRGEVRQRMVSTKQQLARVYRKGQGTAARQDNLVPVDMLGGNRNAGPSAPVGLAASFN